MNPPTPPDGPASPQQRHSVIWLALLIVLGFILLSLLMVAIYRFVPPPITPTRE